MLPKLCGISLQFWTYKYGIIADIEKVFLRLELHGRIAFNVVSSPVLLTAVVKYHLHKEIREARREGKVEEVEALQQLHN
ncbi:unnamed protein product [Enterobius vermicularis]|uniref:Anoctamin n=1 Tax=Enterobius vermicularis TaxID=51028 RepID=A0A0N4V1R1_ENTVE|nr:unnamed protein product [Enterobius vermicularis]